MFLSHFSLTHCILQCWDSSPMFRRLKLSCDSRFQRAFTACSCVFKVIALVWANQRNFFENATTLLSSLIQLYYKLEIEVIATVFRLNFKRKKRFFLLFDFQQSNLFLVSHPLSLSTFLLPHPCCSGASITTILRATFASLYAHCFF